MYMCKRSGDNLLELIRSFYCVGPGNQIQVRLGVKHFYLLGHLRLYALFCCCFLLVWNFSDSLT